MTPGVGQAAFIDDLDTPYAPSSSTTQSHDPEGVVSVSADIPMDQLMGSNGAATSNRAVTSWPAVTVGGTAGVWV
jgi:hypothetical protein